MALSFIGLAWHGLGSMTVSVAEATKRPWALSLYASNVQQDPCSGGGRASLYDLPQHVNHMVLTARAYCRGQYEKIHII